MGAFSFATLSKKRSKHSPPSSSSCRVRFFCDYFDFNCSPPSLLHYFLLQGLRKSSDCGRTKRTIMPHSVPHMVQLRKFVVSENTVFLLLQYAEGTTRSHLPLIPFIFPLSSSVFCPLLHLIPLSLSLSSPTPLSALVPDRCLIEMGVCHRSLF